MKLLDSNIIIHATQKGDTYLIPLLHEINSYVSEITKLEVLGYHGFDEISRQNMSDLFDSLQIIPIDSNIINKAVGFRQMRRLSVGDAIVLATAFIYSLEINTRNISDFTKFPVRVFNPII
jgi:toxin FitB